MRISVIVGLLMIGLLGLGLRMHMGPAVMAPAAVCAADDAPAPNPPPPAPPGAPQFKGAERHPVVVRAARPQGEPLWKAEVTGGPHTTAAAAHLDALNKAAAALGNYMRENYPGYRWTPTARFLTDNRMVDQGEKIEQTIDGAPDAPVMQYRKLTVELRPAQLSDLLQEDRYERSIGRLWQAGRILGGVVVALLVLIGYVRLDDWTRGYFSMALKLTALALVVAGVALLWWVI